MSYRNITSAREWVLEVARRQALRSARQVDLWG